MQIMPRSLPGKLGAILGGAFLLGAGAAAGALWIGAELTGVWTHGFALYALIIGGGVTMTLAAGLMTALFYSDRAGHDRPAASTRDRPDDPFKDRPGD
jgi:hypothetical protein